MKDFVLIHDSDSVYIALRDFSAGEKMGDITLKTDVQKGHKAARFDIKKGENIIKYGFPIGQALNDIEKGTHIHIHNMATNLTGSAKFDYKPEFPKTASYSPRTFEGYVREDGRVGVRNEIWIIPTVGCVNRTAEILAKKANKLYGDKVDDVIAVTHPYGCSQMGDDKVRTSEALAALVHHPNAGGVLILGLGCEENNLGVFMPRVGAHSDKRVKILNSQDSEDEIEDGLKLLGELAEYASSQKRTEVGADKLVIGFKCGGSDGFSGITANPLLGKVCESVTAIGGSAMLTEVPEMFGAENVLLSRCETKEVYDKAIIMLQDFRDYYTSRGLVVYENPSPGNKAGGITTLEEKSLGCVQKGGGAIVRDVLRYGQQVKTNGLSMLEGPGNDIVAVTDLVIAGAQIILFTTGRGTPLGSLVPVIKVATNSEMAKKKSNWIDFDAGICLNEGFEHARLQLCDMIFDIASGKYTTKGEKDGYKDFAIFKDGVTV